MGYHGTALQESAKHRQSFDVNSFAAQREENEGVDVRPKDDSDEGVDVGPKDDNLIDRYGLVIVSATLVGIIVLGLCWLFFRPRSGSSYVGFDEARLDIVELSDDEGSKQTYGT